MLVTLDNLAQRYKVLPSDALGRATTFDLYVQRVAVGYQRYQEQIAQGGPKPPPRMSQQQLQAMVAAAKTAPPMKRKGAKK
jgi:hypothetical protein